MYDLWYWPTIPGRGEFVRLALEAGGIPYNDLAREAGEQGMARLEDDLGAERDDPPFAPPYLIADGMAISQAANILLFLGEKHGLAPADIAGRLWVNELQLTIADMVYETHDTHHPISADRYYEDQQAEARKRARHFRQDRMPKFLDWFERILAHRGDWLAGERWSYADLSLFQLYGGLAFAFPQRMAAIARSAPRVAALHDRVAALPELAGYLASERRLPYSADGIFRHYPELDGA